MRSVVASARFEVRSFRGTLTTLAMAGALAGCGASSTPAVASGSAPAAAGPGSDESTRACTGQGLVPIDAPREMLLPVASIQRCSADSEEDCGMRSTAVWDPQGARWIVLDVNASEGGPERAWLFGVSATASQELAEGEMDAAGLGALQSAAQPFARLTPATDRIVAASESEFSLNTYASRVSLSGALEGWVLEIDSNDDLDAPMHSMTLTRCADGARVALGTREAAHTPCDGDGWYCSARDDECTADELRAEDRLCIQPLGITTVAVSDDGATLLVQGIRQVAGDGGYPPFHWVVALPARP